MPKNGRNVVRIKYYINLVLTKTFDFFDGCIKHFLYIVCNFCGYVTKYIKIKSHTQLQQHHLTNPRSTTTNISTTNAGLIMKCRVSPFFKPLSLQKSAHPQHTYLSTLFFLFFNSPWYVTSFFMSYTRSG